MGNNVIAQALGGDKKVLDGVSTVRDVQEKLGLGEGYTAAINGEPAKADDAVESGNVVTFAKSVKGGLR